MIFIKRLTNIDFAYMKKGEPFGESLLVDVIVYGIKDAKGLVIDFSKIKKNIKKILDKFDHKVFTKNKLNIDARWIVSFNYSKNKLERYINSILNKKLPKNIKNIKLRLYKEQDNSLFFNYTHGLKFHKGGCYNIIHGHYNKFEVYQNNKRLKKGEKWLYQKYLAKSPYIANKNYLQEEEGNQYIIGYDSWSIKLKKSKVVFIKGHPTIENITKHFYTILNSKYSNISVVFYEGIGKGCSLGN